MYRISSLLFSRKTTKRTKNTKPENSSPPTSTTPPPTTTTTTTTTTTDHQRTHTSVFSRLFTSRKPAKLSQHPDTDPEPSSPLSPRSTLSPTSLSSLPPQSPKASRSLRPGIGQPPVFQRPTADRLGTAASGVVLPKRKDGRDLWAANDNALDEEPDTQERLKSQVLVTGWLDAGAATGATDAHGDTNRNSEEQDHQEVDAAPSLPSKLVLRIDTDTHKSPSASAPVVNHVAVDNDDKVDKVPELDPSASSTAGSPSVTTHHTGESVWSSAVKSEKETGTPHVRTLLPTIVEPDATAEEEARDQVIGDLPSSSQPSLQKKPRRRSVLGLGMFGSRRFAVRPLARANTGPTKSTNTNTNTNTTEAPKRRRTMFGTFVRRRQQAPVSPNSANLARAERKMVLPTVHTAGTLSAQIMEIEDEEERRLADIAFG